MFKPKKSLGQNFLINDKILLVKAKEDTIIVDDQKVETELENRIQELIRQSGSLEKVEAQFGAPIKKIKRDNREEVRKMLIIRELQGKKFKSIQVSRNEVQAFYEMVKDSLPEKKPMVKIRHILLQIKPGEASKRKALDRLRMIQDRLKSGESFDKMVDLYSEETLKNRNGLLGEFEKRDLIPALDKKLSEMSEGEISEPVWTKEGVYILKLVKKTEEIYVPLEKIRTQLYSTLHEQKKEEKFNEWMKSLWEKSSIKIKQQ